ncbi:MAG: class I SAM-dependent methyltransferase [Rubrobacteridae bacterium]|nr:class I SAM-dependent methyltransferase [Rubrobacteridae bacterium]
MKAKEHWEEIYSTKETNSVSWFQEHAECSFKIIKETGVSSSGAIIDVGGGASKLVDDLLKNGFTNLTVLDLSSTALEASKNRLGDLSKRVNWLEANILEIDLPIHGFDIWHDRAVFHFLTSQQDREIYVQKVLRSVKPGGHVIIATFAEDGPTKCSGLPVVRYRPEELHAEFGEAFLLTHHEKESHKTPSGGTQQFVYCYCRKTG